MRISDWSSDVCSSDLSGRHQSHDDSAGSFFLHQRRHQRPPIFARAIRKKRMANATSNNPVTRDRDCWRALIWSCSSSFMLTPSGRPLTRRKEGRDKEWNKQKAAVQASSSSRRFPAERKPGMPGPRRLPRSEEHTTALQSLMRISYAVFCLKKKKNKTQI